MKRGLLFILFISLLFVSITFISAQNLTAEEVKVVKARSCLSNQIGDCSSLSVEDKIFSLLSVGQCKDSLFEDSDNSECWPDGNCGLVPTAQATLALHKTGNLAESSKNWLLSNNRTTTNINWFLEIDAPSGSSCDISYDSTTHDVNINEDKTLSSSAGSCLQRTSDGYWLRVSPTCYEKEFTVSCDQPYITSLLYQRQGSSTIYVSESINSASAGASATEKVSSSCFSEEGSNSCSYEGSLWSVLVLDSMGVDMSSYLPYLITGADDLANRKYLPEAFLQVLTEDYREELLSKQKTVNNYNYWEESGNKYYEQQRCTREITAGKKTANK